MLELPTNWTHVPPLPAEAVAGKLDTSNSVDRVSEGETSKIQNITISPVSGGYRLPGSVGEVPVTLLLDTGAAVMLLRQDVWTKAIPQQCILKPWSGATLVSARGTPLTIHGHACIDFKLGGKKFL